VGKIKIGGEPAARSEHHLAQHGATFEGEMFGDALVEEKLERYVGMTSISAFPISRAPERAATLRKSLTLNISLCPVI
jgi:hypothetical protein